jgi:hypothetical protein
MAADGGADEPARRRRRRAMLPVGDKQTTTERGAAAGCSDTTTAWRVRPVGFHRVVDASQALHSRKKPADHPPREIGKIGKMITAFTAVWVKN